MRELNPSASAARTQAWAAMIRTACLTVAENPPALIASMTVSKRFENGSEDDRRQLVTTAGRIAEEYGLVGQIEDRFPVLVVRVTRRSKNDDRGGDSLQDVEASDVGPRRHGTEEAFTCVQKVPL